MAMDPHQTEPSIKREETNINREYDASWGDSAEELRQARLATMQVDDDYDPPATFDPALGPSQSGANMAPLGPRRCAAAAFTPGGGLSGPKGANAAPLGPRKCPADDFLSSLDASLGFRTPAPTSDVADPSLTGRLTEEVSSQRPDSYALERKIWKRRKFDEMSASSSTRQGSKPLQRHTSWDKVETEHDRKNEHRIKGLAQAQIRLSPRAQTPPTSPRKRQRSRHPSRSSQFRAYRRDCQGLQPPQPHRTDRYTPRNSRLSPTARIDHYSPPPPHTAYGRLQPPFSAPPLRPPLQPAPLFASAPPNKCKHCNVNIAEIERTSQFNFPTMCPICHQPRTLLPLSLHQQQPLASRTPMPAPLLPALPSLSHPTTGRDKILEHLRAQALRSMRDQSHAKTSSGRVEDVNQSIEGLDTEQIDDVKDIRANLEKLYAERAELAAQIKEKREKSLRQNEDIAEVITKEIKEEGDVEGEGEVVVKLEPQDSPLRLYEGA